jgi:hypothetical protein
MLEIHAQLRMCGVRHVLGAEAASMLVGRALLAISFLSA